MTLTLSGDRPDLVREVLLWLKQQRRQQGSLPATPIFQIVGIDQLTRQSPTVQNRFLASLLRVDALLTQLDCRLVIWVPRPWLGKIRQAVPGFWRSRSGLFEFMGEPSPQPPPANPPPAKAVPTPVDSAGKQPDLWRVLRDDLSTFEQPAAPQPQHPSPQPPAPQPPPPEPRPAAPPSLDLPTRLGQTPSPSDSGLGNGIFSSIVMPPEAVTTAEALVALQQAEPIPPPTETLSETPTETPAPASPTAAAPAPPTPEPPGLLQLPADLAQDADLVGLWRYIQALAEQQAGPLTLSRAYLALGQIGRDRLVVNAPALDSLDFVTAVYDQALGHLPEDTADWCDALNDLASLYWLQGQHEGTTNPTPWLRRSVATYEKALKGGQGTIPPDTLGRIYGNLATVYGLLANLDEPVPCLEQAVEAYQHALECSPAERSPLDYANLQNSLGAIHWRLAQHHLAQHHLAQAIRAYTEALRYYTAEAAPLDYAMIQNNLGIAYWSLAQHQQPVFLLERAIAAYRAALTYRTLAAAPAGCAATANNLGTAYWDLAQQGAIAADQRITTLNQAIAAYETALTAAEAALQTAPSLSLGFDLWATCHSAGVVHDQLAQALPEGQTEGRQRHLESALGHYLLAHQGWQDSPPQLEVLLTAIVYNVHLNFEIFGIPGQQAVLSKLPGELLPQVLRRL